MRTVARTCWPLAGFILILFFAQGVSASSNEQIARAQLMVETMLGSETRLQDPQWKAKFSWASRHNEAATSDAEKAYLDSVFSDVYPNWKQSDAHALEAAQLLIKNQWENRGLSDEALGNLAAALKVYAYDYRIESPTSTGLPLRVIDYLNEAAPEIEAILGPAYCEPEGSPVADVLNEAEEILAEGPAPAEEPAVQPESDPVVIEAPSPASTPLLSGNNWSWGEAAQYAGSVEVSKLEPGDIISRDDPSIALPPPIQSRMSGNMPEVYQIVIHHTALSPEMGVDEVNKRHRGVNGWGDIGYHYAIYPDGRVVEGRKLPTQGAHASKDNPYRIGVVLLGNFQEFHPVYNPNGEEDPNKVPAPTAEQIRALASFTAAFTDENSNMVKSLEAKGLQVKIGSVIGHQEVCRHSDGKPIAGTACPGDGVMPTVNALRQRYLGDRRQRLLADILRERPNN